MSQPPTRPAAPAHGSLEPAALLVENQALISELGSEFPVLDLACGRGRNGLALARNHVPVVFADYDGDALADVADTLSAYSLPGQTWQVNLEGQTNPLAGKRFAAVLVFNYLHRRRIPALRECVMPGGLVFYETFTTAQAEFGRPRNPDFLLRPGELIELFSGWHVLHSWEGEYDSPRRAMANLIARKPDA